MKTTALLLLAMLCLPLAAKDWTPAPALPNPSGVTVINVSTDAQLQAAVGAIASNQLIVLAAGTYTLSNSLWFNPASTVTNIGIRGATGNPDDVVLKGAGMTSSAIPHGMWVGKVNGMLIADLTIREVFYHPVQVTTDSSNVHFYNLKLIDAGEQFIKGSSGGSPGTGSDYGIVEYCWFEYTNQGTGYTNGVDVHGGDGWIIRHNHFLRINVIGGYGPCILMWNGSSNTIIEGNTFINCEQAIALGLIDRTPDDHSGGIVRNNFIYRAAGTPQGVDSPDAGIMIWDSPNTKVLNNTVIQNGSYANAIEYRFGTTGAEIRNNLCDGAITDRGSGTGGNTVANNVTSAQSGWFVNAAAGNLRLSASAPASVVDAANAHASVTDDFDGNARGGSPDIGASERGGTPANQPPVAAAIYSGTPNVGNTLTLDGTGSSDPDSGPNALIYAWTQISGPSVNISGAGSASASITPGTVGSYLFRLTVDDGADTDTADVSISVSDPALTIDTSTWAMTVTDSSLPGVSTRQLTYGGSGTLTVSVSADQPWLSVSFDNGSGGNTLAASASGTITATVGSVAGLSKGAQAATITVTGNDGTSHQVQISFQLTYSDALGNSGGGAGGGGCAADHGAAFAAPLLLLLVLCASRRRRI
ncbi:MAG: right-handed parallel beta-helix repeat-containing protein [Planctomycetes bacterium]|nr:right-handed parallel beta-helix repeat-containing protein [Planctomycetota bacterium]MCB9935580.1 right-handed parallel beta-helix repeat-containing protein [Planctomycetota bacterium]